MNSRYIIGIVITLVLLSVNQIFIQYWLAQKKYDANTINIAGKQRMLSQRINNEFYKIQQDKSSPDLLRQLFDQWKSAHFNLQSGLSSDKTNPINCPKIRIALKGLNPNIEFIESQLKNIDHAVLDLNVITQNQSHFLPKMDEIVKSLERESDKKLQFIVRIEYFLFFMSLIILILEVVYIYVPIEKSVKKVTKEVREKNKNLEKAYDEIRKKNKELEQITYITSHDLQEPLRTINSLVKLFKSKYSESFDAQGTKMLVFLEGTTIRMCDLIKDLLDYSILGKKKEKTSIDCDQLLETIREDLALRISQSNAEIRWNTMPQIVGIEAELRLLFQNLISNALKFQPPNNIPQININVGDRETHWLFSITDNGIGIEADHIDKVFSIFHRIHSKDKFEGTGIGLAHCAKIVDIHGGEIWVESELNEGSTFFFTIKKIQVEKSKQHEKETEFYFTD